MEHSDPVSKARALCTELVAQITNREVQAAVIQIEAKLAGPLRVAVGGRVSAGKSTLVNALVGQRVAPVDAGPKLCGPPAGSTSCGTPYGRG